MIPNDLMQKCLALKEKFDAIRSGENYFDAMVVVRPKWEEMQKHPALSCGIIGIPVVVADNDVDAIRKFMNFRGKKVLVVMSDRSFTVDLRKMDEMYGNLNNFMG